MKIKKFKVLSVAVCCAVIALWSEAQCMDPPSVGLSDPVKNMKIHQGLMESERTEKIKEWDLKDHGEIRLSNISTESLEGILDYNSNVFLKMSTHLGEVEKKMELFKQGTENLNTQLQISPENLSTFKSCVENLKKQLEICCTRGCRLSFVR